jgi:hypothetical protein
MEWTASKAVLATGKNGRLLAIQAANSGASALHRIFPPHRYPDCQLGLSRTFCLKKKVTLNSMAIFPVSVDDLVPMCNLELLFLYLDVLTVCTYTLLEDQGDYQTDVGTEMTLITVSYFIRRQLQNSPGVYVL